MVHMVVHPAGHPHSKNAQRRIQHLRPGVGKGIAAPVQCHRTAGAAQHHQPKAHQREHQHQKGQVHGGQHTQRQAALRAGGQRVGSPLQFHPHHLRSFIVRRRRDG